MRKIVSLLLLFFAVAASSQPMKSIKEYGVSPSNNPKQNRINLQRAIDEASATGAALYVEPVAGGYPVASVYTLGDLPDYASYDYRECPYCKQGIPIEALVNSFGYSEL